MRKLSIASIALLLPLIAMLAAGCSSMQTNNPAIIGGADGPTSIYLAQDAREDVSVGANTKVDADTGTDSTPNMNKLRNLYPEFFDTTGEPANETSANKPPAKGVEVYVWQMSESTFSCGLMYGTNRNKTEEEIWALQKKAVTVEEAKAILNECRVPKDEIFVIPVIQPYSSYAYEIDDEYRERVAALFE